MAYDRRVVTTPSFPSEFGTVSVPALAAPAAPLASPEPASVGFPLFWLLEHASAPVVYRALKEIAGFDGAHERQFSLLPHCSATGWHLLMMQGADGHWPAGLLSVPSGHSLKGVGTVPAYRRLLELAWDPESPPLACTKRNLFRLLAEDEDPTLLAELRPKHDDDELVRRGRLMLREAAAAALATAGYEQDPRLRGAARRLVTRVGNYLRSPLAQKPWVRVGNQHVLDAEAQPPSYHLVVMLAHMPQFQHEHHDFMDRLYTYMSQPMPRQQPVQQVGSHIVDQSHLVLGDPLSTRNVMDADMPSALAWLELMARLGFLRRNDNWERLFDRLLDDRDRNGVWHPPRSVVMPKHVPAWAWPVLPLSDAKGGAAATAEALSADVTFRLGLIARLDGRSIDFT